jgi:hypothetical protein
MAGGHEVIGVVDAGAIDPVVEVKNFAFKEIAQRGLDPNVVFGKSRAHAAAAARHRVIRAAYNVTGHSTRTVGKAFGVDHVTVLYALGRYRPKSAALRRAADASLRKMSARDFIDSPPQLALLLNGARVNLADGDIIDRLRHLRLCEANRVPHERRRDPTARRVPAEQRIDDIDAAILAARFVRRFGHGH